MTEAAYEQGVLNLAVLYWLHDNRRLPVQSLMCAQGLTVQKPFIASQVYNIMLHTTWHKFSHAHCRTELGVRMCATLSQERTWNHFGAIHLLRDRARMHSCGKRQPE